MKHKLSFGLLFILSFLKLVAHDTTGSVAVHQLRCEYLNNPLGIDVINPRLNWMLLSEERGKFQTAYQVIVTSTREKFDNNTADLWNSGKIISSEQKHIKYAGKPLQSRQSCFWKVRIWDEKNKVSAWSEPAFWTMGLLKKSDWKSSWIGDTAVSVSHWTKNILKPHCGFHSAFVDTNNKQQSAYIDLGNIQQFNTIRMYPASPGDSLLYGYLFPVRFLIESASNPQFLGSKILVDQRSADFANPGKEPASFNIPVTKARYLRLTVSRQSESIYNKGKYGFAIGEWEVISNKRNIAKNAKVVADSPIQNLADGWGPDLLTDGIVVRITRPAMKQVAMTPSPLLRKSFNTSGKKIDRAYIYVSTLGLSEIHLNGTKIGDHILAPEWTNYHKRVQYQTYDVSHLIHTGENVLGATLADGWYIGPVFSYAARGAYGYNRRLLTQLEITYSDGQVQVIGTDKTWKIFRDGPLRSASIFDGEEVDASKTPGQWQLKGYNDAAWKAVTVDSSIHLQISAQMNEPVKVLRELDVVNVRKIDNETYIYDLGQNMVGWCRVSIPDYRGEKIVMRYAEVLNEDGSVYRDNLRGADQMGTYSGPPVAMLSYEPHFTYHGFRYLEIKGLKNPLKTESIKGRVVASSVDTAGAFECSVDDVNQLWKNIRWTQMGNLHSVPTDCPQRDERAGWMGDAQVFSETAIFNMNMPAFFTKWIRDIRDSQTPAGEFTDISPIIGYDTRFANAPGWADAGVIVPWRLYEYYGDKEILKAQFEAMCRFIDNIDKMNPDHLWKKGTGQSWGDWLNGNTIVSDDYPKTGGAVPFYQYSTAFFAYSTKLVSKIAAILNDKAKHRHYQSLYEKIRTTYLQHYYNDEDATLQGNTQAGYALALSFGLLPKSGIQKAAANMVAAVKAYDYRVSTGIQSTIRLMNELTLAGYNDIAYRLLESDRFPSWLYSIRQGATTVWERWDGYVKGRGFQDAGMNSFNHYAIGAVGEWMYKAILGIRPDPSAPGFNRFIIQPEPGGSLTWAKGSYASINGMIATHWNISADNFNLNITVPVNTTAVVRFPKKYADGKLKENGKAVSTGKGISSFKKENGMYIVTVNSGNYHFSIEK